MAGWIKLHREIMDKPIWFESTPEQIKVLMTLLLMASHKETEWEWKGEKHKIQPGQFITSLPSIAKKAGKGVSIQNVRTALVRFKKYNFLTDKSTNKNRLITIVNWASYQGFDDVEEEEKTATQQATQQATNRQLTAIKNVKNKKNKDIKNISPKVSPSDIDLENAHLLYDFMQKNVESPKPNFQKWGNEFRLLRGTYSHTDNFVKYVIQWSQDSNCYMHKNIRSASSFRKKYETLYLDARDQVVKQNKKVVAIGKKQHDFDGLIERLKREEQQQQQQGAIEE